MMETGKQKFKNVLAKTQSEVKDKLRVLIDEHKQGKFKADNKYTFGEWMDVWFENYVKIKVRPSSHKTYLGCIYQVPCISFLVLRSNISSICFDEKKN